jgi:hypothetical protein
MTRALPPALTAPSRKRRSVAHHGVESVYPVFFFVHYFVIFSGVFIRIKRCLSVDMGAERGLCWRTRATRLHTRDSAVMGRHAGRVNLELLSEEQLHVRD